MALPLLLAPAAPVLGRLALQAASYFVVGFSAASGVALGVKVSRYLGVDILPQRKALAAAAEEAAKLPRTNVPAHYNGAGVPAE